MVRALKVETAGRAAWAATLDSLESRLDDAARLMGQAVPTGSSSTLDDEPISTVDDDAIWVPPAHLGALPREFEDRARHLLANQKRLIVALEQARNHTLKHLTAVRSVPSERTERASLYLDVAS